MYVGRIICIGRSDERSWAAYRVSSRSFPNRRAEVRGNTGFVSPINPSDLSRNPYIAYSCIRVFEDTAVVANGTQSDMICEAIEDGTPPLQAIGLSLLAYGYERDSLKTPRIAGAVSGSEGFMGIVTHYGLHTRRFSLTDGSAFMVATYEKTEFEVVRMSGFTAEDLAAAAFALPFERPVCSAAAIEDVRGFSLAAFNP